MLKIKEYLLPTDNIDYINYQELSFLKKGGSKFLHGELKHEYYTLYDSEEKIIEISYEDILDENQELLGIEKTTSFYDTNEEIGYTIINDIFLSSREIQIEYKKRRENIINYILPFLKEFFTKKEIILLIKNFHTDLNLYIEYGISDIITNIQMEDTSPIKEILDSQVGPNPGETIRNIVSLELNYWIW